MLCLTLSKKIFTYTFFVCLNNRGKGRIGITLTSNLKEARFKWAGVGGAGRRMDQMTTVRQSKVKLLAVSPSTLIQLSLGSPVLWQLCQ